MNWREAFFRHARSEQAVRQRLNDPRVEYSHRLHYLQMVSEKLAKAYQIDPNRLEPPPALHQALVRMLQTFKSQPNIRRRLGYNDAAAFRQFIDSLLDLAAHVERLAPSAARLTQPNPEYPWVDPLTGNVCAPVDFNFPFFDPRHQRMVKFERLIQALLDNAE